MKKISLLLLVLILIQLPNVYSDFCHPAVGGARNEWGTNLSKCFNTSFNGDGFLKPLLNVSFYNINTTNFRVANINGTPLSSFDNDTSDDLLKVDNTSIVLYINLQDLNNNNTLKVFINDNYFNNTEIYNGSITFNRTDIFQKMSNITWADNASGVDWFGINRIPAGFADGVDDTGAGSAVTGVGNTGNCTIWESGSTLKNGSCFQSGANMGFGISTPTERVVIDGSLNVTQNITLFGGYRFFSREGAIATNAPFIIYNSMNATIINTTSILTVNLFDRDASDFFDESGCGTTATLTGIDQTGAVSCSAIAITSSQVTDFSTNWNTIWQNHNSNYKNDTTVYVAINNNLSVAIRTNLTQNSTALDLDIDAGDSAINSSLITKLGNLTDAKFTNFTTTNSNISFGNNQVIEFNTTCGGFRYKSTGPPILSCT